MIDMGTYWFKDLNTGKTTPNKSVIYSYVEELFELEHVLLSTKKLHTILGAKYKEVDLNKKIKNQWQNRTEKQCNELFKLLQYLLNCSMEQLVPGKWIKYI